MATRNPALASVIGTGSVELEIGGRKFIQEELGIEQAAVITETAVRIVTQAVDSGAIDMKEVEAINSEDTSTVWPVLMKSMRLLPEAVSQLFSGVLLTDQGELLGEEDVAHVRRHLKIRQAMSIVTIFVQQNDIPGVVQSFFSTRDAVTQGLREITMSGPTDSPAVSNGSASTTGSA